MDYFIAHGVRYQSIATFVAGVRFAARSKQRLTNSQLADSLSTLRNNLNDKEQLKISGRLLVDWGSVEKLKLHPIDHPSLTAILDYCLTNELCPETDDGVKGLCEVHVALKKNNDFPEFIKKRLTRGGSDE